MVVFLKLVQGPLPLSELERKGRCSVLSGAEGDGTLLEEATLLVSFAGSCLRSTAVSTRRRKVAGARSAAATFTPCGQSMRSPHADDASNPCEQPESSIRAVNPSSQPVR